MFSYLKIYFLTACQAATFNIAPYNTSAVVGENGTMACMVTLAQGENVQWKKVSYLFALHSIVSISKFFLIFCKCQENVNQCLV